MRFLKLASAWALLSLILAACAQAPPTAQEIMERMRAAREQIGSGHAIIDLVLDTPEHNGSYTLEAWGAKRDRTDAAGQPIGQARIRIVRASQAELTGAELVNDGTTFWLYHPAANRVFTGALGELRQGRIGAADPTAQMLRMQQALQHILDGSNVTLEGESVAVAGRDTWQVLLTPKPETAADLGLGSQLRVQLWIDKATNLPVKGVIDGGALGHLEATATTFEIDAPLPPEVFSFTPPAGAEVIDLAEVARNARPQVVTLDEARAQVDFPLLTPAQLPAGVQLEQVQVLKLRGQTVIQNFNGPILFSLVQGRGELPSEQQAPAGAEVRQVQVRGVLGTMIIGNETERGTLLRWRENGVTLVVAGTLSPDEALAIAESLRAAE
ncbi:outer membrane lipoprotein-sorting protein [Kallotenue papyrolyticum]|uniref:outer membrane lipoprotein-sorting protein n=1 Tax=Kallotenue papyrolyticum TaxID=1325125 RepID=UPI000471B481|nr:DUF2092 domain-containing protein [Kallotenue papyrolyticum]